MEVGPKWQFPFNIQHITMLYEYKNLSRVWGANRKIHPRVTFWHHEALPSDGNNSVPAVGQIFLSAPNNHDRFIFFWSPMFGFNSGVTISKSRSYMWTSAKLKIDVVCNIAMMSTPKVLMTELCDLLYNHYIDNMLLFVLLSIPRVR